MCDLVVGCTSTGLIIRWLLCWFALVCFVVCEITLFLYLRLLVVVCLLWVGFPMGWFVECFAVAWIVFIYCYGCVFWVIDCLCFDIL